MKNVLFMGLWIGPLYFAHHEIPDSWALLVSVFSQLWTWSLCPKCPMSKHRWPDSTWGDMWPLQPAVRHQKMLHGTLPTDASQGGSGVRCKKDHHYHYQYHSYHYHWKANHHHHHCSKSQHSQVENQRLVSGKFLLEIALGRSAKVFRSYQSSSDLPNAWTW